MRKIFLLLILFIQLIFIGAFLYLLSYAIDHRKKEDPKEETMSMSKGLRPIQIIDDFNDIQREVVYNKIGDEYNIVLKCCCFPLTYLDFKENTDILEYLGGDKVYSIRKKCCGKTYTMKTVSRCSDGTISSDLYFLKKFIESPLKNVIDGFAGYVNNNNHHIIYESLSSCILSNINFYGENFDEKLFFSYAKSLFIGIATLHAHNIVHSDIKPENIGINRNRILKIFDFGVAVCTTSYKNFKNAGTIGYISPERLAGHSPKVSDDWWAYGIVLYELLENYYPFRITQSLIQYKREIQTKNIRPFKNDKISDDLKDLIHRLLEEDNKRRLGYGKDGVKNIANHKYFKDSDLLSLIQYPSQKT